ncbi:response regulator [bacterium]|nr:response regulator [bacterium]
MNKPRILIVDDEKSILQSYRSILEKEDDLKSIEETGSALFEHQKAETITEIEIILGNDDSFIIIEEELSTEGYEIVEATQGMDAVKLVEKSLKENYPFSLVYMDVRMPPGIDGVEAAKLIRELDPNIEIVIMTAYADYNLEEVINKVGNPDRLLYFNKPFNTEQITNLTTSLTQHWYLEKKRREQDKTNE